MAYILDASRLSTRDKFKDNDEQAVESRFGAGIFRRDLPQFRLFPSHPAATHDMK